MTALVPDEPPIRSLGRRAGVLYLLACLPAPFATIYVPNTLLVAGDVAATAARVREHATLLRVSMICEAWSCLFTVFAAITIYRLLRRADLHLAVATAALMLVAVPIQLLNLVNHFGPLVVTSSAALQAAFTTEQLDGLVYVFLRMHSKGLAIAQILWGIWLIPWGIAGFRTQFMPRWIAVAIIVAGVGYMLDSSVTIAAPQLSYLSIYLLALGIGELPNAVWMLAWGAREPSPPATRTANL
jgi:hypothetical protein